MTQTFLNGHLESAKTCREQPVLTDKDIEDMERRKKMAEVWKQYGMYGHPWTYAMDEAED